MSKSYGQDNLSNSLVMQNLVKWFIYPMTEGIQASSMHQRAFVWFGGDLCWLKIMKCMHAFDIPGEVMYNPRYKIPTRVKKGDQVVVRIDDTRPGLVEMQFFDSGYAFEMRKWQWEQIKDFLEVMI